MVRKAHLAIAALLCVGCTSINRATEYRANVADARNYDTAFEMMISIHPRDDTLLISPRVLLSDPVIAPAEPGAHLIRRVAESFLGDTGCTISAVRPMARPWFEAAFVCPPDFDLRAAMVAQRAALREGAPVQRANTQ